MNPDLLRRAPARLPEGAVVPRPIEFGKTPAEWPRRRREILARWRAFMGSFPERCTLQPEVLDEQRADEFTRRRVRYRVEAAHGGIWAEAHLLLPHRAPERAPSVVVFHPTNPQGMDEPAGLAGPPSRHTAQHLARRGYVVLCPQNFLWGYRGRSYSHADGAGDWKAKVHEVTDLFLDDHPGWTGMGKMVWDGIRAVDYLRSLAAVDPDRIGCFGMSLGAKEALYVPAFDERLRVSVSIDGGLALAYSNWEDPWYLGARIREPGFDMDNHEVLSLVAPRAFFLIGSAGGVDEETGQHVAGYDGERSWPFIEAVLPLYRMLGAEKSIGILNHAHGHSIPKCARVMAYAWLDAFLQ